MTLAAAAFATLLSALLAGPSTGASLPPLSEAPIVRCEGLACVDAAIGSAQLRLAFDTGNIASLIDLREAKALGLSPVGPQPPRLPHGAFATEIPELKMGGIVLRRVRMIAFDLQPDLAQHHMPKVQGTISYAAFGDRLLQLDAPAQLLRASAPLAAAVACPGRCASDEPIHFGKHGPPMIVAQGFEVDGRATKVQIDTMFSGTLLIYDAAIGKLGLSEAAKTDRTRFFPFTDLGVEMREANGHTESFLGSTLDARAPLYFPTAKVHQPDGLFDGTVGMGLLDRCVLTLDLRDHWLSCEAGPPRRAGYSSSRQ